MEKPKLHGRVAVVTGGARGIGFATTKRILSDGGSVVVLDFAQSELDKMADSLQPYKGMWEALLVDIRSEEQVRKAVDLTSSIFGTIDILVNNAGLIKPAKLEDVSLGDWNLVLETNLKGTLLCTQAVLPVMKKKRYGKIVNVGSRASLGKLERTSYAATKAGLIGMTRTWALELGQYNINVNYVGPGPIETSLFKAANPANDTKTQQIISSIPLKRMGQPEDVANLIAFLASDEASFMTGQNIFICGGITVGAAAY